MGRAEFGVSRLRVADSEQLPEGSSAIAFTPVGKSYARFNPVLDIVTVTDVQTCRLHEALNRNDKTRLNQSMSP